ncbi:beta-ketoacyl-ACP synthase II [candidate division KSB1 bacterium]
MQSKVLITGLGTVNPCGNTIDEYWESLKNGCSGIGTITRFDIADFSAQIAGELKNFDPIDYIDKKEQRRMDRFTHYAIAAANMAIADAGIDFSVMDRDRIGVVVGSGVGGIETHEIQNQILINKGPARISPFYIVMMIADIAPGHISIIHGLKGPNYAVTSACATASHAIGDAFKIIQRGDADMMICGGAEAPITRMSLAGFDNMRAISRRNDDPQGASRPFDADRDGFVMGEGAGIVVLESEKSAVKRNAKIYAEFAGMGFTGDAFHITAPAPNGEGAVRAMRAALNDAGMSPEEIEYINAHGTSTEYNDRNETEAIKMVFGDYAYKIPVSSTKSMAGHLLGASGGVELIAALLAMKNSCIPPTINYTTKDPECDLDYVPNTARQSSVRSCLSNTFGFGGHNACLIVREYK